MVKSIASVHPNCDSCGANDFEVLYRQVGLSSDIELTEMFGAAESVYSLDQIVRCRGCGLLYTNPRLPTDLLDKAYADGMHKVYLSQTKSKTLTLLESLEWIETFVDASEPLHGLRLLDVGTASGLFLQIAEQNGWVAAGIEPNCWLAEYGKNRMHLNIQNATLDKAVLPDNCFDVVTMWDVIEHFDSPARALRKAHATLKNNGYLFLITPNFDCLFSRLLRRRWWFIMAHHLYYFTPRSIGRMLRDIGFEVVDVRRHFGTWDSGYIENMLNSLNKSRPNDLIVKSLSLAAKSLRLRRVSLYAGQMKVAARKIPYASV